VSEVEWRPWPQDPRYTVGSDGTILGPAGRPWKHYIIKWGYCGMTLRLASGRRVGTTRHRVVCETFHGPCPPGKEAAHLNGVPADCAASNLRWKTKPDNHRDRLGHGTHGRKLTAEQVQEIRLALGSVERAALAELYGVAPLTVKHIWTGKTWRYLAWPDESLSA
jgi:hypothetical protein